jgi:hypothetical protein
MRCNSVNPSYLDLRKEVTARSGKGCGKKRLVECECECVGALEQHCSVAVVMHPYRRLWTQIAA